MSRPFLFSLPFPIFILSLQPFLQFGNGPRKGEAVNLGTASMSTSGNEMPHSTHVMAATSRISRPIAVCHAIELHERLVCLLFPHTLLAVGRVTDVERIVVA